MKLSRPLLVAGILALCAGCTAEPVTPPAPSVALATPKPSITRTGFAEPKVADLTVTPSAPSGKGLTWLLRPVKPSSSTFIIVWSDANSILCGRATQARLQESPGRIIAEILPGKETHRNCAADAVTYQTTIHLAKPIGTRTIFEPAG